MVDCCNAGVVDTHERGSIPDTTPHPITHSPMVGAGLSLAVKKGVSGTLAAVVTIQRACTALSLGVRNATIALDTHLVGAVMTRMSKHARA